MNSAPMARASIGQCRGDRGSQPRERIATSIRDSSPVTTSR